MDRVQSVEGLVGPSLVLRWEFLGLSCFAE